MVFGRNQANRDQEQDQQMVGGETVVHSSTLFPAHNPFNTGHFSNCTRAKAWALVQFDLGLWGGPDTAQWALGFDASAIICK